MRTVVCVLALILVMSAQGAATAGQPNIIIVVVDTLRADRVGANGNQRGLTPFFDELARRGTAFVNAYATSSWTYPSVASLFTSRYPSQHHVINFDRVLAAEEVTLAELLASAGYLTGGFSANFRLTAENGYAQGFARWQPFIPQAGEIKPTAARVKGRAIEWLKSEWTSGAKPTFLYFQFMEPHAPYAPRAPYAEQFARLPPGYNAQATNQRLMRMALGMRGMSPSDLDALASLYDGEVASVDAEVRTLFAELEQMGFLRNAIILITADHGEEFGEHGELQHGITLYQAAIRIPLIIVAPALPAGRIVYDNVSLVDLAPTLLEWAAVPVPPSFEGRSVSALAKTAPASPGAAPPTGDVLVEREKFQSGMDFRAHDRALISGTRKVVVLPKGNALMYDLSQDPDERSPQPVTPDDGSVGAALLKNLEQKRQTLQARVVGTPKSVTLDEATKEKLRALGYQP